jgi:hypothetical protein
MPGFLVKDINEKAWRKLAVCRTSVPLKKWQGGILLTRQEGVNAMRVMCGFSRENTDR